MERGCLSLDEDATTFVFDASNLILYYIYETAFSFLDISYASALTIFLLALLALTALAQFFFLDRRTHYR